MAKLTDFTTPTGQRGNLLKPMSLVPMVLGTVVMAAVVTVGFKLYNAFVGFIPGRAGSMLSGGPFIRPNQNSTAAPTGPNYKIFS